METSLHCAFGFGPAYTRVGSTICVRFGVIPRYPVSRPLQLTHSALRENSHKLFTLSTIDLGSSPNHRTPFTMAINHDVPTQVERTAVRTASDQRIEPLVDLSRREDTSVLERSRIQVASVESRGVQRDVGNPTFALTDGDRVVAGADRQPLSENSLNAAKVKKGEGYFQSAERLLGGEFTHKEKKEFTEALKKGWATDHPDAKTLRRGDELLTEKNRDAVLKNIEDPGLRARISERLNKGLPEGNIPRPEPRPDRRQDQTPERRQEQIPGKTPDRRTEPRVEQTPDQRVDRPEDRVKKPVGRNIKPDLTAPENLSNVPDGAIKNPLDAKFNVGDRFTGLTSTYGAEWNGRKTASGIRYHNEQMTAASRELPFGTVLSVYNPATQKEVQVVVTDKGPFAGKRETQPDGRKTYERVVDLSTRADRELGRPGLAPLQYKILHIPDQGDWGMKRPNLSRDGQHQLHEVVKRLSRR